MLPLRHRRFMSLRGSSTPPWPTRWPTSARAPSRDAKTAGEMGFDERLAMIADAEWDSRRTNKRLRYLRKANLPEHDVNIADVRHGDDRGFGRAQMLELSNCSWIAEQAQHHHHGGERRGQDLDIQRARGGRLQRVLRRPLHEATGAARRPHRIQGRGVAQAAQEVHRVRLADHRRLAAGVCQVKRGQGDHGSNRGEGQSGIARPVLAVPSVGMTREPRQRSHRRRRHRPHGVQVLHHTYRGGRVRAEANDGPRPESKPVKTGGAVGSYRLSTIRTTAIAGAYGAYRRCAEQPHRPGVPYAGYGALRRMDGAPATPNSSASSIIWAARRYPASAPRRQNCWEGPRAMRWPTSTPPYTRHRCLRNDNVQERANREFKRRSRVAQAFPSRKSLIRMAEGALFRESPVMRPRDSRNDKKAEMN